MAKTAAEQIATVEAQEVYDDPETLSLADMTDSAPMQELKLDDADGEPAEIGDPETPPQNSENPEDDDEGDEDDDDGKPTPDQIAAAINISNQLLEDPSGSMTNIYESMTAKQQAEFIASLVGANKAPAKALPDGYEGESDFEKALLPIVKDIQSLPEFTAKTDAAFGQHARFINEAHLRLEVMTSVMEGIAESLGVKIPEADYDQMLNAVRQGKTYQDATKAYKASMSKMTTKVKQSTKDRPAGTKSAAGGTVIVRENASLAEMLREYKKAS